MESRAKIIISALGELRVKQQIDISEFLETKRGGIVELLYVATNVSELIKAVDLCVELKIPYLVIGSGSKLDLSSGFEGLVIRNRTSSIKVAAIKGKASPLGIVAEEAVVDVDSGVSLRKFSTFASEQGLSGWEGLEDLPGTIGGNFYINPQLQSICQQLVVYEKGKQVTKTDDQLKRDDLILTAVFRLKAKV